MVHATPQNMPVHDAYAVMLRQDISVLKLSTLLTLLSLIRGLITGNLIMIRLLG